MPQETKSRKKRGRPGLIWITQSQNLGTERNRATMQSSQSSMTPLIKGHPILEYLTKPCTSSSSHITLALKLSWNLPPCEITCQTVSRLFHLSSHDAPALGTFNNPPVYCTLLKRPEGYFSLNVPLGLRRVSEKKITLWVGSLKHPDVFKAFIYGPVRKRSITPALVCWLPPTPGQGRTCGSWGQPHPTDPPSPPPLAPHLCTHFSSLTPFAPGAAFFYMQISHKILQMKTGTFHFAPINRHF